MCRRRRNGERQRRFSFPAATIRGPIFRRFNQQAPVTTDGRNLLGALRDGATR